jgi:hypothetical protein
VKSLGGILSFLVALAIGLVVYNLNYTQGPAGSVSPMQRLMQAIEVVGVKNDLVALARAERLYLASHETYAELDELRAEGSTTLLPHGDRRGYNYSVAFDRDKHFTITATAKDLDKTGWPTLAIDDTMQISASVIEPRAR